MIALAPLGSAGGPPSEAGGRSLRWGYPVSFSQVAQPGSDLDEVDWTAEPIPPFLVVEDWWRWGIQRFGFRAVREAGRGCRPRQVDRAVSPITQEEWGADCGGSTATKPATGAGDMAVSEEATTSTPRVPDVGVPTSKRSRNRRGRRGEKGSSSGQSPAIQAAIRSNPEEHRIPSTTASETSATVCPRFCSNCGVRHLTVSPRRGGGEAATTAVRRARNGTGGAGQRVGAPSTTTGGAARGAAPSTSDAAGRTGNGAIDHPPGGSARDRRRPRRRPGGRNAHATRG